MDYGYMEHMRDLFGLGPNASPIPLQFPRLPPGLMHPITSRFAVPTRKTAGDATSLMPNIEDFQQAYRKNAAGLLESGHLGLVPPGHPLYQKGSSLNVLRSENEKLQKENIELKKQLGEISKPDSA